MNRFQKNNNGLPGTMVGTLSPKVVIAAVLLLVMAGLWLRVLLRGKAGPARAQAQTVQAAPAHFPKEPSKDTTIAIRPISLPVIAGKHDQLEVDPFVVDPAQWFKSSEQPGPNAPEFAGTDEKNQKHWANLQRISKRLVLEAVVKDADGVPIKACVDGIVLFKGSTIKVKENGEIYELKVTEVCETEMKLEWQVFTLTIKMPSSEWLDLGKGGVL